MCGIIGYIGSRQAYPLLLKGLERLEYRGYDSAGICTVHKNTLLLSKKQGRVQQLGSASTQGNCGIAHTRWATHGVPADKNAHPFTDTQGKFVAVHNGIIENYLELKEELRKEGTVFSSDTDSEVIVHLIAQQYKKCKNLMESVQKIVGRLAGTYAFCVLKNDVEEIIAARNGSPLLIGIGENKGVNKRVDKEVNKRDYENEYFLASDASAMVEHTKKVIYMNDFEIARITKHSVEIFDFQGKLKPLQIKELHSDIEQAQKQGHKHFMLKEIFEQPEIFEQSLKFPITFPFPIPKKIIIVACGTASYAGLLGKYFIEKIARIPVENVIASEFRYQDPLLNESDLVVAISQSGETADTLAAVRLAREKGAKTFGIINVKESTLAREVDYVHYTQAGPEIGVASTKAFLAQIVALLQFAYLFSGKKIEEELLEKNIKKCADWCNHSRISNMNLCDNIQQINAKIHIKEKMQQTIALSDEIKHLAEKYWTVTNFLYIGRNLSYPLALEGALKLKEISYIHAEAYPAGELKHGPLALVSEETPTFAVCPQDEVYDKTLSNIAEIKARKGKVIALATEGDEKIKELADDVIYMPKVEHVLSPFLCIIPLQLFAYHMADRKNCDIDKPRNLAKSVTVE